MHIYALSDVFVSVYHSVPIVLPCAFCVRVSSVLLFCVVLVRNVSYIVITINHLEPFLHAA